MKQPNLMKNRKAVTKRIYPAVAVLVLGCLMLWGAVQAAPTSPQTKISPTPSHSPLPQNVNVVNPVSSPVPVRDVENAARLRFQTTLVCNYSLGWDCSDQITVPSGKELVIEFVSISQSVNVENRSGVVHAPHLEIGQSGPPIFYFFPVALQNYDDYEGLEYFVGAYQTRLYADPSDVVKLVCHVNRDLPAAFGSCSASLSGYLVSVTID